MIAGLKYRQRFGTVITQEENKEKYEFEKAEIERFIEEIEDTVLFQELDEINQQGLRKLIKKKEYLVRFNEGKFQQLAWYQMIEATGVKPELMSNMYTYLSLYAHPSYVSVFQFGEMFGDEADFLDQTSFKIQYGIYCICMFIADFIKLYPAYKNTFKELPLIEQIIINFNLRFIRGEGHEINNSNEALG